MSIQTSHSSCCFKLLLVHLLLHLEMNEFQTCVSSGLLVFLVVGASLTKRSCLSQHVSNQDLIVYSPFWPSTRNSHGKILWHWFHFDSFFPVLFKQRERSCQRQRDSHSHRKESFLENYLLKSWRKKWGTWFLIFFLVPLFWDEYFLKILHFVSSLRGTMFVIISWIVSLWLVVSDWLSPAFTHFRLKDHVISVLYCEHKASRNVWKNIIRCISSYLYLYLYLS